MTEHASDEKVIVFSPAFHDCAHRRGIGCVHMTWTLRRGDHVVEWNAATDWGLSKADFFAADPMCGHSMHQHGYPHMRDIDERCTGVVAVHSAVEGNCHLSNHERCGFLDDRPCWFDCSYLQADEPHRLLRTGGSDAVWAWLENWLTEYIVDRYETVSL